LIGLANSGKSTIIEVIRQSLERLSKKKSNYLKLLIEKINPNSVTILQLYGFFDAETKNWSDGILPKVMREFAEDADDNIQKWIVMDGPVDPSNFFK
jgi:dynein heavy chain